MVIVDTSVVYKWFSSEEEHHLQSLKLHDAHIKGEFIVMVPDLLLYELANAWSTKTDLSPRQIVANLLALEGMNLKIEPVNYKLIRKALTLAKRFKITVYDAVYAVLAKEKKCNLITADTKFLSQVNLLFIKELSEYR